MKKEFAVILSGCGNKDGAEIHEAVTTLLAIKKAGHNYLCFAPDVEQRRVVNHYNGHEVYEKRNVLVESARIARGKVRPLSEFQESDFDVLMIPGGQGAALNLSTFGVDGAGCLVNEDVARAVKAMHKARKPIGALCIAPVILGKLIPGVLLTVGKDDEVQTALEAMGALTEEAACDAIVVDAYNRVVSGPCYMYDANIAEVALCAERVVGKVLEMACAHDQVKR